MNITKIAISYLKHKPLNTALSVLLFALGSAMVSLLLLLGNQVEKKLTKTIEGVNLVVGAKGSSLQMILSSVYHIDYPTGNIPLTDAIKFSKLKINGISLIDKAIPLALGDNYKGYRIVGTNQDYPDHYKATLTQGVWFSAPLDATIGSEVAKATGLKIGDTFFGAHNLDAEAGHVHDEHAYKVVGIMAPNESVVDQLIFSTVESVWVVHEEHDHEEEGEDTLEHAEGDDAHNHEGHDHSEEGHVHDHTCDHSHDHEHEHEEGMNYDYPLIGHVHSDTTGKELTSLLITYAKDPMGNPSTMADVKLPDLIDKYFPKLGYAYPLRERDRLLNNMGIGINLLGWMALIFILVSALSVFISLYNSMKERQYDIALIRVMGASPGKVMWMILLEGMVVALIGCLAGLFLSHLCMTFISGALESSYRYSFGGFFYFLPKELLLIPASLLIGLMAGIVPAMQAYNTDISKTLGGN